MTDSFDTATSIDASNYNQLSAEVTLIKTIINLDIIETEIETIQNAILFSKIDLINNNILTPGEVETVSSNLINQGIPSHLMDEALEFVTTAAITTGEIIMYIISIPNFSVTTYQQLRIEAIINNSERIVIPVIDPRGSTLGGGQLHLEVPQHITETGHDRTCAPRRTFYAELAATR
ncbi:uncharacterized protein LOC128732561 [Sabethes cyaneus]|uniref:uncharacterized protein LOC128732561 n=1 Tax=Sabethes cyaneus TaxID=53552 RepID=UPI00237E6489|nr:uncharacterized protein LOC128732561 [Sabethes cyaneus]